MQNSSSPPHRLCPSVTAPHCFSFGMGPQWFVVLHLWNSLLKKLADGSPGNWEVEIFHQLLHPSSAGIPLELHISLLPPCTSQKLPLIFLFWRPSWWPVLFLVCQTTTGHYLTFLAVLLTLKVKLPRTWILVSFWRAVDYINKSFWVSFSWPGTIRDDVFLLLYFCCSNRDEKYMVLQRKSFFCKVPSCSDLQIERFGINTAVKARRTCFRGLQALIWFPFELTRCSESLLQSSPLFLLMWSVYAHEKLIWTGKELCIFLSVLFRITMQCHEFRSSRDIGGSLRMLMQIASMCKRMLGIPGHFC